MYLVTLLVLVCGVWAPAAAQEGRMIAIDQARAVIPDVKVFTEQGKKVRLYSDLIKNKIVLLSFFYTTCTNVCPVQANVLSKMQAEVGGRLGHDVFLISISMNPEVDTPQALKHWARTFGVRKGWTMVSSNSPEIRKMIKDFTGNDPGPRESHYSIVFIGNDRSGSWLAADGTTGTAELIKLIDVVANRSSARSQNNSRRSL